MRLKKTEQSRAPSSFLSFERCLRTIALRERWVLERKVGFTENTAARHRRGGGREVTVTSKLHTQEYRDIELNIVVVGFTMGFTRDHCIERKVMMFITIIARD